MAITRKIVANHFANMFSDACKFVFYVHAFACMYIHPAPSLPRPDENVWWNAAPMRKRVFNVYFWITFAGVRRPKWAFERWFIIRVVARTKSPARFHCPRIFLFSPKPPRTRAPSPPPPPPRRYPTFIMANEEKRRKMAVQPFSGRFTHARLITSRFRRSSISRGSYSVHDRASFSFICIKRGRPSETQRAARQRIEPHTPRVYWISPTSVDLAITTDRTANSETSRINQSDRLAVSTPPRCHV